MMLTLLVAGLVIGCQAVGEDVRLYNPDVDKDCPGCDLKGIDLKDANLTGANLRWAYFQGQPGQC